MPKRTHGLSKTPEWSAWWHAIRRCTVASDPAYGSYGGRGIRVCSRWAADFLNFLADVGKRPTGEHSLDRCDNNLHYSCGSCNECIENGWTANCRWATDTEQHNNKRNNSLHLFRGREITVTQAAREVGVSASRIFQRLKRGWDFESALDPVQYKNGARHD